MVDVIDIRPQGGILVETDGQGLHRLSGWYTSADSPDLAYHGIPLETDDFTGLSTFEVCADLACAQALAEDPGIVNMNLCIAIAHEVGGDNGQRFLEQRRRLLRRLVDDSDGPGRRRAAARGRAR